MGHGGKALITMGQVLDGDIAASGLRKHGKRQGRRKMDPDVDEQGGADDESDEPPVPAPKEKSLASASRRKAGPKRAIDDDAPAMKKAKRAGGITADSKKRAGSLRTSTDEVDAEERDFQNLVRGRKQVGHGAIPYIDPSDEEETKQDLDFTHMGDAPRFADLGQIATYPATHRATSTYSSSLAGALGSNVGDAARETRQAETASQPRMQEPPPCGAQRARPAGLASASATQAQSMPRPALPPASSDIAHRSESSRPTSGMPPPPAPAPNEGRHRVLAHRLASSMSPPPSPPQGSYPPAPPPPRRRPSSQAGYHAHYSAAPPPPPPARPPL